MVELNTDVFIGGPRRRLKGRVVCQGSNVKNKNWEAADHSFRKFREFYPDGDIYIKVDDNGDFENYKKVAEKYNAECSKNPFQIGYPGNHQQHNIGRDCWPLDNALLWCDNIYWACKKSDSKFMIILEEDSFILKPISIINKLCFT